MKIGLINGSPKAMGSTSEVLLDELKALIPPDHDLLSFGIHHAMWILRGGGATQSPEIEPGDPLYGATAPKEGASA